MKEPTKGNFKLIKKIFTLILCNSLIMLPIYPQTPPYGSGYGGGYPASYGSPGMGGSYGSSMGMPMGGGYGSSMGMPMGGGYGSSMGSMGGYGSSMGAMPMGGSYGGMGSMGNMGGMASMGGMGGGGMNPGLMFNNPYMGMPSGMPMGNFNMAQAGMTSTGMMGAGMALNSANSVISLASNTQSAIMMAEANAANVPPVPLSRSDDFFPQCETAPASEGRYTSQACAMGTISSPITQMSAMKILNKALTYEKSYHEIQADGGELNTTRGLQCINFQAKKLYDKLAKERQKIDKMIAGLGEQNAKLKKGLEDKLRAIADLNSDLDGGQATRSDKKRNMQELFNNPACNNALDFSAGAAGGAGGSVQGVGLYDIKKMIAPTQQLAQNIQGKINSGEFSDLLNADIAVYERLTGSDVPPANNLNFPSIARMYVTERQQLEFQYTQMKQRAQKDFGYTMPETLKDYERSKGEMSLPKKEYFAELVKKRDCIDNPAYTVTPQELIKKIEHLDSKGTIINPAESATLSIVKEEIERIFSQQGVTTAKMLEQVRAIENKYGTQFKAKMSKVYGYDEGHKYFTVSQIIDGNSKFCDQWFKSASATDGSTQSRSDILNQNYQEITDFVKAHGESKGKIADTIRERVLNCKGIATPKSPADCTARFNYASEEGTFCVPQAKMCADNTLQCMQQINGEIEKREKQVQEVTQSFNKSVEEIVSNNNDILKNTTEAARKMGNALMEYFPGGRLNLGGAGGVGGATGASTGGVAGLNFFVQPPSKDKKTYGTALYGDGNLAFLDEVTEKLLQIKTSMEQQENNIKTTVTERIAKLKAQYLEEEKYWQTLAQTCQKTNQMYMQQMQQMQQMQNMAQQQQRQMANNACMQLQNARVGPGCQQQAMQLTQSVMQATSVLGPQEISKAQEFQRLCNQFASENPQGGQQAPQDPLFAMAGQSLSMMCGGSGTAGLLERVSNSLRTEGWKYAAALNARYPNKPPLAAESLTEMIQTARFDGNTVSGVGNYTREELNRFPTGSYILNMAELNWRLKNTKIDGAGGQQFCEYVNNKVATEMQNPSELVRNCQTSGAATLMGASADAINATQDVKKRCIYDNIDYQLASNKDLMGIKSVMNNLTMSQGNVQIELSNSLNQRMGEISSPSCAGMMMMPSATPSMMPGGQMMQGMPPMTGVRAY